MRYQRPIVMDLSVQARHAAGQDPLGCFDGNTPGGASGWCQNGISAVPAASDCTVGPDPAVGVPPVCMPGSSPTTPFCMVGAGGDHMGDTCTVGPSAAP